MGEPGYLFVVSCLCTRFCIVQKGPALWSDVHTLIELLRWSLYIRGRDVTYIN